MFSNSFLNILFSNITIISHTKKHFQAEKIVRNSVSNSVKLCVTKTQSQKTTLDSGVVLTGNNNAKYTDLYGDIIAISDKAKKVFKNTLVEDQYMISKILKSMRSSKSSGASNPTPPSA